MGKTLDFISGGLMGAATGMLLAGWLKGEINEIKVVPRENKPSVMRVYSTGQDDILVQDKESGKYMPLKTYLEQIKDEAEQGVENADIRKAVEWYK